MPEPCFANRVDRRRVVELAHFDARTDRICNRASNKKTRPRCDRSEQPHHHGRPERIAEGVPQGGSQRLAREVDGQAGGNRDQCRRDVFESGAADYAQRRAREVFSVTAARMSALNDFSSIFSPSRKSIARRVLPSRLELKRRDGSSSAAPLAKVSFTACL